MVARTKDRVVEAFKLILEDKSVKGVLINIFGGIVRCDMIAEAIVAAVKEINVNVLSLFVWKVTTPNSARKS